MKDRSLVLAVAIAGLLAWPGVVVLVAQDVAAPPKQGADVKQTAPPKLADLPAALKASPGCLGVHAASLESGQQVIFSWFENKKAVLEWYYSDVHQALISRFFPNAPPLDPLKDVADNGGPIMVIASVTPNDANAPDRDKRPFKQIAIELYQPLPGGLALGGRFAPESVKVAGMRERK